MALYPFGNQNGNNSWCRRCRRRGGPSGAIVSAVSWEGGIASTGAVGSSAGGGCSVVVAGSGIGPAATVGLGVGADDVGADGFTCTSGCFDSLETRTTDNVRTTRTAMSKPPPTITCAEERQRAMGSFLAPRTCTILLENSVRRLLDDPSL
jgi:hypothetical protein